MNESIVKRIKALLDKTVENGCTEQEAMAATEMAARLLEKHNLTLDDLSVKSADFIRETSRYTGVAGFTLWRVCSAIAKLTHTERWSGLAGAYPHENTYFGMAHEVEIAKYITDICYNAMHREEMRYLKASSLMRPSVVQRRLRAFMDGMSDRLASRILKMIPTTSSGNGLIVLRDALIKEKMAESKISLTPLGNRGSRDIFDGYEHGKKAADKVRLDCGIGFRETHSRLR